MLAIAPTALPAFHPALLLMAHDEKQCDVGPVFLDRHDAGGDAWGMEQENSAPDKIDDMRDASVTQGGSSVILRDESATLDAMPSFMSTGARIDYACAIALKTNREIRSESALADAVGAPLGSLRAMRKEAYGTPRREESFAVMRRIALLSGLSFEWIRFGDAKNPVPLSDGERANIELELGLGLAAAARQDMAVAEPVAQYAVNTLPFDAMSMMKLWGMIAMHSRVRAAGWNADDVFACLLQLYPASNAGRASAEFIDKFIQDFPASR